MTSRCYPCTNGNHTGTNGTGGCRANGCPCPCNADTARKDDDR